MRPTTQLCAAAAGLAVLSAASAQAESGVTTGVVVSNSGVMLVRVSVTEGRKSSTKFFRFEHGVDTEVSLGEEKIRGAEVSKNWHVRVTWKQEPDERALKPGPDGRPDPAKAAIANRNPLVAERIEVVTETRTMLFAGFEGSSRAKVTYGVERKPGRNGKVVKRIRMVTATLYDNVRFFVDSEEVDKAAVAGRDGQECRADVIVDGAAFPTIFRLTFKGA